jgi:hypothetical protein
MKSRGLGDDIKKITSAIKLDQLAEKIAKLTSSDCGCDARQENTSAIKLDQLAEKIAKLTSSDCGCDARQEKLNKMFPYKKDKK